MQAFLKAGGVPMLVEQLSRDMDNTDLALEGILNLDDLVENTSGDVDPQLAQASAGRKNIASHRRPSCPVSIKEHIWKIVAEYGIEQRIIYQKTVCTDMYGVHDMDEAQNGSRKSRAHRVETSHRCDLGSKILNFRA